VGVGVGTMSGCGVGVGVGVGFAVGDAVGVVTAGTLKTGSGTETPPDAGVPAPGGLRT